MKRSRLRPDVVTSTEMDFLTAGRRMIDCQNYRYISKRRGSIHVSVLTMILLIMNTAKIQITRSFTFDCSKLLTMSSSVPRRTKQPNRLFPSPLYDSTTTASTTTDATNNKVNDDSTTDSGNNIQRYKEEAAKIRLEAEKMDLELAIIKIQNLQNSIQKLIKKHQLLLLEENDTDNNNNRNNQNYTATKDKKSSDQSRESIEQLEEQIRNIQKKIGNYPLTTNSSTTETVLLKSNSDSTTSTSSGTFVASVTTLGSSDVPLMVSIDTTAADRIVLSSSGSVISKATLDAAVTTTTTTTSAGSTITKPSRINIVPTTSTAQRKSTSSSPTAATTTTIETLKQQQASYKDHDDDANTATIYGFDKADLDLYLPVAIEIEATMSNATAEERLQSFRASSILQTNFQKKISQMFVEPIQDMTRMEELKQQFLDSTSSREKELIKRQIDTITNSLEKDGPFLYSDSVYRPTPELSIDEMNERVAAMSTLPNLLQTIYKQRFNLDSTANITLAILLDHYEMQLQLIEQVKLLPQPFTPDIRNQIVQAIESLPIMVRNHVATVVGLDADEWSMDDLVLELSKDDGDNDDDDDNDETNWWNQIVDATSIKSSSKPSTASSLALSGMDWSVLGDISTLDDEGNDIEMIDRSRYVYDFYPAIARMEQDDDVISYDTVDQISKTIFDSKKSFMVTNRLERIVGGYYIRGRNLLDEDGSGNQLLAHVQNKIRTTNLTLVGGEDFEYFYIRDPAPLTDEEIELEYRNDPVFVMTRKNVTRFYNNATPLTKSIVTLSAFVSMGLLAIDSFHLGQSLLGQLELSLGLSEVTTDKIDATVVLSSLGQVVLPLTMVQVAHEIGHRFVAWKDKFNVGIPTFIPFIPLGCIGTITPLTSPPPSLKSMFDFGMSGPMVGLLVSFTFLANGLLLTSMMDMNQLALLPSLPTYIIRSSTLGGAFIEWFLGSGSLITDFTSVSLPLHPFAIAGYIGMISNALALLPLGKTDGGRIAVAMFGRRGILLVKTLVAAILCGAGLFGLDDSGILLNYVIIVLLWQNEIETPARNEVEELDFIRGCFGISIATLVFMILLPMQS